MGITSKQLTAKAQRDYELVLLAREKGDQKAYSTLLSTYREPIYYMLLKMTNNTIDADDLTIETFGKAFKSLNDYSPDFAFSTWLFRIATNNCIDYIRKNKTITVSIDKEIEGEEDGYSFKGSNIPCQNPDPEELIIDEQQKLWMRDIVSKLKPHYRVLVEERYFMEKSYEEISKDLNLPIGTVKAKLFRARNLLLNIIKNNPHQK